MSLSSRIIPPAALRGHDPWNSEDYAAYPNAPGIESLDFCFDPVAHER